LFGKDSEGTTIDAKYFQFAQFPVYIFCKKVCTYLVGYVCMYTAIQVR
jgi:hypothetical protein